jgi:hypothetical protein
MTTASKNYEVTLRFQFPAWDERDGITYNIIANNKLDARRYAMRHADRDGHLMSGKGRYTFTAVEIAYA